MPFLNIRIASSFVGETCTKISTLLTDLTANVLRKKRELVAIEVEFIEPQKWFIGGVAIDQIHATSFYLDIKVTEGTNTKNEKADFVRLVFAGLADVLGNVAAASYIVIHEVGADSWGYQGQTQEFRYVKDKML